MPLPPGHHTLGPDDGTLTVRTGKTGAASKAGHNLVIEVTSWSATLDLPEGSDSERTIALRADPRSLRVREGGGGVQTLGDDDKANIEETIDGEVLKGTAIEFRSTRVEVGPDGTGLRVQGDLQLSGVRRPVAFHLDAGADGRLTGGVTLRQTEWGIKPYSTLFGTLKVADEVEVVVDALLPGR